MAEYNSCASLMNDTKLIKKIMLEKSLNPLADMLGTQYFLQTKLVEKLPKYNIDPKMIVTKGQLIEWLDRQFDAMMDEFRELKTSVGGMSNGEKEASAVWKKWKSGYEKQSNSIVRDMSYDDQNEMCFEFIDMIHFILNMALGLGLTADDIYLMYMIKNHENLVRYKSGY